MIDVPVYDTSGNQTDSLQVDEAVLGGEVRMDLLKQAVVSYRANQRQGSARTKGRSMIEGSTRKLYRQKGTGNARMGSVRNPIRRGGGHTFAKLERSFRRDLPRRMKQLARNSALLAKLQASNVAVIDGLTMEAPRTKVLHGVLKALGADGGCVLALDGPNEAIYKSGRNLPKIEVRQVQDLNAYEILRRKKLLFTRGAFEVVLANPQTYRAEVEAV